MRYYEGNLITGSGNLPTSSGAEGIFDLRAQSSYMAADKWPFRTNQDPTANWVSFARRFIASDTVQGDDEDYTGAYDVSDVQVPATFSGTARIYIGHKVTSNGVFYADCAISGIQLLSSASATSVTASYIFAGNTQNSWATLLAEIDHPLGEYLGNGLGFPESLATTAARSFATGIGTADNEDRWSFATSTGSANTGAASGISTFWETNVFPSPGDGVVDQSGNVSYIYRETSGSDRYSGAVCRSPEITFSGGEVIRIAHLLPGFSESPMNPNDTLFCGVA